MISKIDGMLHRQTREGFKTNSAICLAWQQDRAYIDIGTEDFLLVLNRLKSGATCHNQLLTTVYVIHDTIGCRIIYTRIDIYINLRSLLFRENAFCTIQKSCVLSGFVNIGDFSQE